MSDHRPGALPTSPNAMPLLRKRLQAFQRTGMYELGRSAMEYAVDSMNSVGNNLLSKEKHICEAEYGSLLFPQLTT